MIHNFRTSQTLNRAILGIVLLAGLADARVSQAAPPTISRISGVSSPAAGVTDGVVDQSIGTAWNGWRAVNDEPGVYPWTITGQNFGTARGTATLYNRSVPILSWSNTSLRLDPSGLQIKPERPWDWAPFWTTLVVKTADGQSVTQRVNIAPTVKGRVYSQCTWWATAVRRLQLGKAPSPKAYDGYTPIDANWVPQGGDQLQWPYGNGKHAAIIESVSKSTANGVVTYSIRISQYNASGDNKYSTFDTRFVIKGAEVSERPRFSAGSAQASLYFR